MTDENQAPETDASDQAHDGGETTHVEVNGDDVDVSIETGDENGDES